MGGGGGGGIRGWVGSFENVVDKKLMAHPLLLAQPTDRFWNEGWKIQSLPTPQSPLLLTQITFTLSKK